MNGQRGGIIIKLIVLLFLVLVCGVIFLLRNPILRFMGSAWMTEDPLERADALIVLSDDNFAGDRAARAAELYRKGMAPLVVASGRRLRRYAGIAELMEHDLIADGVPKEAIVQFSHTADSTREEAEALTGLVNERRWRRVIVVTSNVHVRRARYIFRRVFPATVDVRLAGAPDQNFIPTEWWKSRRGLKQMFHEVLGMFVTMWELRGKGDDRSAAQSLVGRGRLNPQSVV
jgi:uncharacterized SAM-binding protein YcdF (DUF218 family)